MKNKMDADYQDRLKTRQRLKIEKPVVYNKLLQLDNNLDKAKKKPPVIEIAYRYLCNLKCKHCFASKFEKRSRSLSIEDLKSISRQADKMGVYQFILQGGEPLYWSDFEEALDAIDPCRFYMGLVTNATLLNREKVGKLKHYGIDKLVVSLDYYDKFQYEKNRQKLGLFDHTLEILSQANEAGLRVIINTVVTKKNVRSQQLLNLIEFAKDHDFIVYVNFASPLGNWEGRYELLINQEDSDYIYELNRKHEIIKRDIFPYKGIKVGCPALKSVIYITEFGDVLPCPFIHISVGNIFEKPLSEIISDGMRVKWFRNSSPLCLASEDQSFIREKIAKTYGKASPVNMYEIFTEDEFFNS
jgi:MoaA/NifB/PqqE/SkfB family radical SAM enzyme